jgi:type IV secretion system protein VirB1
MPLFESLAAVCAPSVAVTLLVGIATVESGGNPMVVRDGGRLEAVSNVGAGVSAIVGAGERGRELGIGLFGLTATRLQSVGMSIADGFEPCLAMRASQALMERSRNSAGREGLSQNLAERLAIRDWWRPDYRYITGAAFEAAVRDAAVKNAELAEKVVGGELPRAPTIVSAKVNVIPVSVDGRVAPRKPGGRTDDREMPREVAGPVAAAAAPVGKGGETVSPPPTWDVFARARSSRVMIFGGNN